MHDLHWFGGLTLPIGHFLRPKASYSTPVIYRQSVFPLISKLGMNSGASH